MNLQLGDFIQQEGRLVCCGVRAKSEGDECATRDEQNVQSFAERAVATRLMAGTDKLGKKKVQQRVVIESCFRAFVHDSSKD